MPKASKQKKNKRKHPPMAASADRHHLYELSVQCPEAEVDFLVDTFQRLRGRPARLLREDFCGTASVCCEWVGRHADNRAIGVDLDPDVLRWGAENRVRSLKRKQRDRVSLINDNVLNVQTESPDIIVAMNFSYWLLQDRATLLTYYRRVRDQLRPDGVFFLDAYGGYESHREIEEEREIDEDGLEFVYIWEQERFNPIDHELTCNIHFEFPDGSRIDKAFSYTWRLWTLPEIRDLLREAGFERVTVYWQGWDEDGDADGDFEPATRGDADAGWICYLTAEK